MGGRRSIDFKTFDKATQEIIKNVAIVMGVNKYYNIFAKFDRQYTLPRFVCYKVLYDRGYSYPMIGAKFCKDHTSIIHGVKRTKKSPKLMAYANIVNYRLRQHTDEINLLRKFKIEEKNSEIIKKIKDLMNLGYDEDAIVDNIKDVSKVLILELIENIKKKCKQKLVPDYKKSIVRKIYV